MSDRISYDPDEPPVMPPDLVEKARRAGMHVVHIICDEAGAKVGEPTGVSFFAMTPFLPRSGERLQLQDGKTCIVRSVFWRIVTLDDGAFLLVVNMWAELPKK